MSFLAELKEKLIIPFDPYTHRVSEWWHSLEIIQRRVYSFLVLFCFSAMIFSLLLVPMQKSLQQKKEKFTQKKILNEWMQQSVAALSGDSRSINNSTKSSNLYSIVNDLARKHQLSLKRSEPEGNNKIRLWLENKPFDLLFNLLFDLKKLHGINVVSITLDSEKYSGFVSAKILLEK